MDVKVIAWDLNYSAFFAPLSENKAQAIQMVVEKNVNGLKSGEMDNAVARLCATWQTGKFSGHPGVREIISAIWRMRNAGKRQVDELQPIRYELRRATPDQRWDICCRPESCMDCETLLAYAQGLPGGVVEFRPPKYVDMVRDPKTCGDTLSDCYGEIIGYVSPLTDPNYKAIPLRRATHSNPVVVNVDALQATQKGYEHEF